MINNSTATVAIVILNYNGEQAGYLQRFLPSVYASMLPQVDLYVIDNASTDDSVAYLKQEGFVSIKEKTDQATNTDNLRRYLIVLDENYWFAGGYNKGLKQVQADYYILLNSDVEVASDWIPPIIDLMESDAQIAACQPKIRMVAAPELFEHAGAAGGWMDALGYPFCRGRLFTQVETDKGQYDSTEEVFWATGAALFIRSELFHAIGGFDEDYKAHMEEIDLCWRLKRANYKIMVCPDSTVWHVGGGTLPQSSPHKTYLNFRNSLATVFKNIEGIKAYWIVFLRLLLDGVAGVRFLFNGEWRNIGAIVRAHWSFFGDFGLNRRKRKALLKQVQTLAYQQKIGFRAAGWYPKSIVWQHFVKGKKTFSDLDGLPK